MNIGIDARMYGPHVGGGGLGRYVEQLVTQLQTIDHTNRYVLFFKKENVNACALTNPGFEKRLADIHWYTLKEQLSFGRLIDKEKLDLIHFPHWNVPLFLKTPFVVTIHDLILLDESVSSNISTKNPLMFYVKYVAYRWVLSRTISRAKHIITVSEATKSSILKHFPKTPKEKISVLYEGVAQFSTFPNPSPLTPPPYFLYVGNAYPHKNLECLLSAFEQTQKTHPNVSLVLCGKQSVFYDRLLKNTPKNVVFINQPSDQDLSTLYKHATAFVYPSRIEGFGLPPLEALSLHTPVIASDIPVLREILQNHALFFDPNNPTELANLLSKMCSDPTIATDLLKDADVFLNQYSFKRMAELTRMCYQTCDPTK